ncbi:MAG: ABC transporter ATP-binding protein [Methylobacterium mesophilicum]|nr:ABC transporter ATP-binding protein [Methylobacterium mesophilicum]
MNAVLLDIENLSVTYPGSVAPALAGLTLKLQPGERLGVIGESGSGKSTLARTVAGLLSYGTRATGRLEWPALARTALPGRDIGFVFQDAGASLDPVMRVGDQVAEAAHANRPLSWREAKAAAVDLLATVRLPDPATLARSFPHQLSGGQRQRVAIAAALAGEPRLLIADEATSALDTVVQAKIASLLDRLVRERNMALVFITHDIALASNLVSRIAVLRQGRLVEEGPTRAVIDGPREPYTRDLLDAHWGLPAP